MSWFLPSRQISEWRDIAARPQ